MTDGQSFYLILTLFYLLECIKFAPTGSEALVSPLGRFGNCSLRQPFTIAWGLKKAVFLAPLLPWPASMYFISGYLPKQRGIKRIPLVSSIRHHQRFLQKATQLLRRFAALNLLNFFLVLPLIYIRSYDEKMILSCLAYCYGTLLATAIYYHRLHTRILPSYQADRLKTTIYTALLPWHAPRCADEIYLKSSLRWHPLSALVANAADKTILARIQYHWRAAHFHPHPKYNKETVADTLAQGGLSPGDWLNPPATLTSPQYCPCCHHGYEMQAIQCADCEGAALEQTQASKADSRET